jgi:hypothetical protein
MKTTLSYIFLGLSIVCYIFAIVMSIREDVSFAFSFRFYLLIASVLILIIMTLNNIIKNKKCNNTKFTEQ